MREERLTCPRCRGDMGDGFLLESGDYNWPSVTRWVEGAPEQKRWTGLNLKGRRVLRVRAFRCERCGCLELHAPEAPDGSAQTAR
jgi:hypothetical protein